MADILLSPLAEAHLSFRFIQKDLTVTIIPTGIFMALAWTLNGLSLAEGAPLLFAGIGYFWLFIYTFCLSNQLVGQKEDQINKPFRPLPSGLVTSEGTLNRYLIFTWIFVIYGTLLGLMPWTLLWVGITILHNFTIAGKVWFLKSGLLMALGVIAQLSAAWEMMGNGPSFEVQLWTIALATWVGICTPVQDFRDVDGDRTAGRRTFPIVFAKHARAAMAIIFVVMALALGVVWGLLAAWSFNPLQAIGLALILGINLWIAVRILVLRTAQKDDRTYTLYTLMYCLLLLGGFVIL